MGIEADAGIVLAILIDEVNAEVCEKDTLVKIPITITSEMAGGHIQRLPHPGMSGSRLPRLIGTCHAG